MAYAIAAPEIMTSAATDLATIGSDLSMAYAAAAAPTVVLVPAAADEVSADIAHLFSRFAEDYQGLAGRAALFHERFAQHFNASAGSYANAEAANVASLRPVTASGGSFRWMTFLNSTLRPLSNSIFHTVEGLLMPVLPSLRNFLGPILGPLFDFFGIVLFVVFLAAIALFDVVYGFLAKLGL